MTDSKIKSAKKLLASGVPPRDVASNSESPCRPFIGGFRPPSTLSVLYCPFSDGTPVTLMHEPRASCRLRHSPKGNTCHPRLPKTRIC
jgi:hypothetical protein